MRVWRLAVIVSAVAAVHFAHPSGDVSSGVPLAAVKKHWPEVVALGDSHDGMVELLDAAGNPVGWATTTFPQAAKIDGYAGPSELWIAFDPGRRVKAVGLVGSADTPGHVTKVVEDAGFWSQWTGRHESELGRFAAGEGLVVSGASLTSEAMVRGVAGRFGAEGMGEWFPAEPDPKRVAAWFDGGTVAAEERGIHRVEKNGSLVGWLLRSSRMGVAARGFQGVSDVWVALDGPKERVLGVSLEGSRDNEPYWGDVAEELKYSDPWRGRTVGDILGDEEGSGLVVSGASMTAEAVGTSVVEMLQRMRQAEEERKIPLAWWATGAWLAAGIWVGLRRGVSQKIRWAYAAVSVAAGIAWGWMLGQDQWIGWARHGIDLQRAMPLFAMTVVALLTPLLTGKNIYCSRICPHGAAQTILGAIGPRRSIPGRWHRWLQRIPWVSLVAIWAVALVAGEAVRFSQFEPFEVWSAGWYAWLPAVIWSVGLLAALVLPQGYCHYGCPTGAVMRFLAHAPKNLTRRDGIAGVLVVLAWGWILWS